MKCPLHRHFRFSRQMAEEVGVEPTRHRLGISTALKAAHLTGDDSLPMRYLNQLSKKVNLPRSIG